MALESSLETFLAPILTPLVASFVAPALAIAVGSLALIITMRGVDAALNTLFGVLAEIDVAKMKAEQVKSICAKFLPGLIEEREQ